MVSDTRLRHDQVGVTKERCPHMLYIIPVDPKAKLPARVEDESESKGYRVQEHVCRT